MTIGESGVDLRGPYFWAVDHLARYLVRYAGCGSNGYRRCISARARGETAKPCNLLKLTAIVTRRVPTTKQRWGPGAVQKPQQKTERRSQLRANVPNANTYSIACMKESYKNEKPAEEITQ
jgi:hypothetical protein